MATKVTHYEEKDGKIVCGTKAKAFTSSTVKSEVTCKRCIAKMAKTDNVKVETEKPKRSSKVKNGDATVRVEKTKTQVTLTFGGCLMTFPMNNFRMFRFSSFDGKCCTATSTALVSGQVKAYLKEKERMFFVDSFNKIKESGSLTGMNVYNHFKG